MTENRLDEGKKTDKKEGGKTKAKTSLSTQIHQTHGRIGQTPAEAESIQNSFSQLNVAERNRHTSTSLLELVMISSFSRDSSAFGFWRNCFFSATPSHFGSEQCGGGGIAVHV